MPGFRDIIGHEKIIAHMQQAIRTGNVSHAYILDGPEHAGKRMLADAFAMALQCEAKSGEGCLVSLPLCDECIITKVENSYEADAWFTNLDEDPEWELAERGEDRESDGLIFHFDTYRRIR